MAAHGMELRIIQFWNLAIPSHPQNITEVGISMLTFQCLEGRVVSARKKRRYIQQEYKKRKNMRNNNIRSHHHLKICFPCISWTV